MANVAEILHNLKEKQAENNNVASSVSDLSLKGLEDKINWHNRINNYAIYALATFLVILATLSYNSYLRLEDKILNITILSNQRLDDFQEHTTDRLDGVIKDLYSYQGKNQTFQPYQELEKKE